MFPRLGLSYDPDGAVGVADVPDTSGIAGEVAGDGLSDLDFLEQTLAHVPAAIVPGEVKPLDEPQNEFEGYDEQGDPVEKAIADAAVEPVVEEPVVEPVAEVKPEVSAEAEEDLQNLSIAALNKRIATDPAFKAVMEKAPELRKQLFFNARLAERSNKYDDLFQTPALAQEIKATAEDHYKTQELYAAAPDKFLQKLFYDSLEKDEAGNLKLGADNRPIDTGRYDQVMSTYRTAWYDSINGGVDRMASQGGAIQDPGGGPEITSEDAREALRIIQILTEGKSSIPAPGVKAAPAAPSGTPTLSAEVQAQLDELASIKSQRTSDATKTFSEFQEKAIGTARTAIETDVKNLLSKRLPAEAALSDYMKGKIIADTVSAIELASKANSAHQALLNRALRATTRDDAGIAKIVAMQQSYAKELLGRELSKVLSKATPGVVAQNRTLQTKVTNQVNRREVATSGGVSAPSRPDVRQAARDIDANARKSGKPLNDLDFVDAVVAAQTRR